MKCTFSWRLENSTVRVFL